MEETYLHIENGGVTFSAGNDMRGYLTIAVQANHFGNITHHMELCTDAESMRKIGEMFIAASEQEHEVYECAAKVLKETIAYGDGHASYTDGVVDRCKENGGE